jgi:uncharacterized protein YecE (DUF72 family)
MTIRIGISGWRYKGWRNSFYPPNLIQARELAFASRALQTIEINGSHYALQTPKSYLAWHAATPTNFMFSVKAPRYVTHILRLRNAESAISNFFASGLFNLREKLGPILWQFPPSFRYDETSFQAFLQSLPSDTEAAAKVAKKHDAHIKNICLEIDQKRPLRHAIEVRHPSFFQDSFVKMLRKYNAALVASDSPDWPYAEDVTADFIYMRLHGKGTLYSGEYPDTALDQWAGHIQEWAAGREPDDAKRIAAITSHKRQARDVFCYFDNDLKVHAPFDAARMMSRLREDGVVVENDTESLRQSLWASEEMADLLVTKNKSLRKNAQRALF